MESYSPLPRQAPRGKKSGEQELLTVKYYSQFCGLIHLCMHTLQSSRITLKNVLKVCKLNKLLDLQVQPDFSESPQTVICFTMTLFQSLRTGFICHHFSQYAHPFPPHNLANATGEERSVTVAKVSWQKQTNHSGYLFEFPSLWRSVVKLHINTCIDTKDNSH